MFRRDIVCGTHRRVAPRVLARNKASVLRGRAVTGWLRSGAVAARPATITAFMWRCETTFNRELADVARHSVPDDRRRRLHRWHLKIATFDLSAAAYDGAVFGSQSGTEGAEVRIDRPERSRGGRVSNPSLPARPRRITVDSFSGRYV